MENDKKAIEEAIKQMIANHDSLAEQVDYRGPRVGFSIYGASEKLEKYIDSVRLKTLGWMFQECLKYTGEGKDLKQASCAEIMENYDKANI